MEGIDDSGDVDEGGSVEEAEYENVLVDDREGVVEMRLPTAGAGMVAVVVVVEEVNVEVSVGREFEGRAEDESSDGAGC